MKNCLFLIVCVFLLAASACSVVKVTEPIGEEPIQIQPKEWEGLWKLYPYDEKEDFLLLEVSDSEKGVIKVQSIGRKPESVKVYLRESNGWTFGSYRDSDKTDDTGMFWGRFKKDGDLIVFWAPNFNQFLDLVEKAKLPDEPKDRKGSILLLLGLKPEHMKLITSDSKGELFEWDKPSFMVRVSDDID